MQGAEASASSETRENWWKHETVERMLFSIAFECLETLMRNEAYFSFRTKHEKFPTGTYFCLLLFNHHVVVCLPLKLAPYLQKSWLLEASIFIKVYFQFMHGKPIPVFDRLTLERLSTLLCLNGSRLKGTFVFDISTHHDWQVHCAVQNCPTIFCRTFNLESFRVQILWLLSWRKTEKTWTSLVKLLITSK